MQCLRKFEYYIRSIKKGYFNRNVRLLKSMFISITQYLVGPRFAWITAPMRRGLETISLWHCSGVMEAQVALIAAFRSSALLGLVSLFFLLTIPNLRGLNMPVQVRRVCWPIKHSNTMVIEPAFGTFGSVGRCQILLENEISISIKLVSRRKHEVL